MSNDPPPVIPPLVAATESTTPAADLPAAGEANLPAPTVEQARVADKVFSGPPEANALVALAGLWTGMLILHDVAVEIFDAPEEEEEQAPNEAGAKDNQPVPADE